MRNQVHLIAYADRLGGTIPALTQFMRDRLGQAFGGIHVLPFYSPFDGADAGFDPVDHTLVDPRLGTWADVRELASTHEVMADLIVNHVSADSAQFRDVRERGTASPYASLFLTMASVFPDGAHEADLARIYRPRPGLPFTPIRWADELRYVWTTFSPAQIDIDVHAPEGQRYLASVLDAVTGGGVTLVRLDAVGYAVKTPGTTSFMTPETFEFIGAFADQARARGAEVLVEVHSYYQRQIEIAAKVDLVYDFALPPLVLHALYTGDGEPLMRWLELRPGNAVTVLDTHDGIGVIDVGPDQTVLPGEAPRPGLLTPEQIDALVEGIHERTGGASRLATGAAASNLDLYQVNSTFYDALADDQLYLAARVIQFFTPGIPQVYYVGALAGANDLDLLERTGVGRDINRHHYSELEAERALQRPVVQKLLALCRLRSTVRAFDGALDASLDGSVLRLSRRGEHAPGAEAHAAIDLATGEVVLRWADGDNSGEITELGELLAAFPG